jgi:hypothetical protein
MGLISNAPACIRENWMFAPIIRAISSLQTTLTNLFQRCFPRIHIANLRNGDQIQVIQTDQDNRIVLIRNPAQRSGRMHSPPPGTPRVLNVGGLQIDVEELYRF